MPEWSPLFLEVLAETSNVSAACRAVNVGRTTAYDHRNSNPGFAAAWDEAVETGTDALELEARRRAMSGCEKPVYQGGQLVGMVKEYSDTLMIVLLKAHRPEKYRERSQVEHSGSIPIRYVNDWRTNQEPPDSSPAAQDAPP
jgi:hypothetical protein